MAKQIPSVRQLGLALGLSLVGGLSVARASGPTERIQQVLPHPTDPNLLTVRFGMASSGYLYSKDGGKTFRAMCSTAVDPEAQGLERVRKISLRSIAATAASTMDSEGRVIFSQYGSLFSDDSTGCTWNRTLEFDERWAFDIQPDPVAAGVVWAAVGTSTEDAVPVTTLELARRNADGVWTTVGPIVSPRTGEVLLDGNMRIIARDGKTRIYVTANLGSANGYVQHVYVSDDLGKTWRDSVLPLAQQELFLLAIDPQNVDRLVGAIWKDGEADVLLLSENGGRTFAPYPMGGSVRAISGVTFDKQGRFLVADQGDGVDDKAKGGLLIADRLGAPLRRVEGTSYVDCIHYRALTDTLYMCSYDKLGTLDPETFKLTELVTIEKVAGLLECPGRDMVTECKEQFNEGPSWCCTGHFPFTPFCGAYDVTRRPDGRPVFCGLAGREYERPGSTQEVDASTPLPSVEGDPPLGETSEDEPRTPRAPRSMSASSGGCALSETSGPSLASGVLSGILATVVALSWRRARSRRR